MNGITGFGEQIVEADEFDAYENQLYFTNENPIEGGGRILVCAFAPNTWVSVTKEMSNV